MAIRMIDNVTMTELRSITVDEKGVLKFGEDMDPWCKKGDCVLIPPFAGIRLVHKSGQEFRLINDDTVQGVVEDPRGSRRAV